MTHSISRLSKTNVGGKAPELLTSVRVRSGTSGLHGPGLYDGWRGQHAPPLRAAGPATCEHSGSARSAAQLLPRGRRAVLAGHLSSLRPSRRCQPAAAGPQLLPVVGGFAGERIQSFSQNSLTPTAAKEFQIGLCGVVEADSELFCNSQSEG